jgi:hypothetical protein
MPTKNVAPAAHEQMLGLISGYWVSQLLFVAARLGIADAIAKHGPATAAALARRTKANAEHLRRVLRALSSVGVFAEGAGGKFRLTPLAQTLRSDQPGSLRSFAEMIVDDYNWQAWGKLADGVTAGGTPFESHFGMPIFAWLNQHPVQERTFAASMASISGTQNAAVAKAYPFGELGRLVDVGGAHGHLLATILGRHKKLRGVLYDQPQVVASAASSGFLASADLKRRSEIVGGDFFKSVPAGLDGYLMKFILHDWDDDECTRILGHCREAMATKGRVLVVEHVIPPGNAANWGKLLDINMLVLTGGLERTKEEFRALFARAGLKLKRVVPTECPLSVLEAVRA